MRNDRQPGLSIQNVSSWILRIGVIASVSVMLLGIFVSFLHNRVDVERMEHSRFEYQPSAIWTGLRAGSGKAIIEVGIYMLVLTPILRVAASVAFFTFEERDPLYAVITSIVLAMTLAGLLLGS